MQPHCLQKLVQKIPVEMRILKMQTCRCLSAKCDSHLPDCHRDIRSVVLQHGTCPETKKIIPQLCDTQILSY